MKRHAGPEGPLIVLVVGLVCLIAVVIFAVTKVSTPESGNDPHQGWIKVGAGNGGVSMTCDGTTGIYYHTAVVLNDPRCK